MFILKKSENVFIVLVSQSVIVEVKRHSKTNGQTNLYTIDDILFPEVLLLDFINVCYTEKTKFLLYCCRKIFY